MKSSIESFVKIGNKKYVYRLTLNNKTKTTHVFSKSADIDEDFLNEDIPALIIDLPTLILAEMDYHKKQDLVIKFRVTAEEKTKIMQKALQSGFKDSSKYLRNVALK